MFAVAPTHRAERERSEDVEDVPTSDWGSREGRQSFCNKVLSLKLGKAGCEGAPRGNVGKMCK